MSHYISLTNPHRRKHFDFFRTMAQPHFNLCANVPVGLFLDFIKKEQLPFTPTMVYLIAKAANRVPEFRQRIRGERIWQHDAVHPSFAVNTKEADVFSFCTVDYFENFQRFLTNTQRVMAEMVDNPSMEDDPNRDDFLFLSAIPWVPFTSFQHAMHNPATDSVPRITWGKYFESGGQTLMPLSVQAHHAVVDGRHTGRYFQLFESYLTDPETALTGRS